MQETDYYRILGVGEAAGSQQIRDAYRKLAFTHHPDRNRDQAAAADMMKRINEAYAVLSDPGKRRQYDRMRRDFGDGAQRRFRGRYTDQDIFDNSDIGQVFEEMARSFGFRGVDEIFGDFYGPRYRTFKFDTGGVRGRGVFVFGGPRRFRSTLRRVLDAADPRRLERSASRHRDVTDTIRISSALASAGGPYAYRVRHLDKRIIVSIPAGLRHGQKIRLAGLGVSGPAGTVPGDLYLRVMVNTSIWSMFRQWLAAFMEKLRLNG